MDKFTELKGDTRVNNLMVGNPPITVKVCSLIISVIAVTISPQPKVPVTSLYGAYGYLDTKADSLQEAEKAFHEVFKKLYEGVTTVQF